MSDEPVFRPILKRDVPTPAEKQAKWDAKQRKKRPSMRYIVQNPKTPYQKQD